MQFKPIAVDAESLAAYVRLFELCFAGTSKFNLPYLQWLYQANPDGQVIGFDAWADGELAAHYACIPTRVLVGQQVVTALLSLNTATHPNHQGKGLFTQLAQQTYERGAQMGVDCVYGVANANSTPGFVRKLGFQHAGALDAKVGLGAPSLRFGNDGDVSFKRVWSDAALAWRCQNPANRIQMHARSNTIELTAPALGGSACNASAELPLRSVPFAGGLVSPARLFIGRVPQAWGMSPMYVNIPERFRPSPLNLIYRSLSSRVANIDPASVLLSFLDFDAY
jgi:GNAT superfamily N-acetyltransferase